MVNLISMRMHGHARASGYDRLTDYLDACVIRPIDPSTLHGRIINRALTRLSNKLSGLQYYGGIQCLSELYTGWHWLKSKEQIFHFLYGENSYRYLGELKFLGRKNLIICTYHLPPNKFQQIVKYQKHVEHVDAIIVVSTLQLEFFSSLIGSERVYYVPHGIDVDYFKPDVRKKDSDTGLRCLFVGRHLRDFETLVHAVELLNRWKGDFRFIVVTSGKVYNFFNGIHNVEFYSGISDEELLKFYQQTDVLVLPLLGSTANNTLLEAMACGLPIVSTDIPGVRDYTNDACALLTPPGQPKALAEAVLCLNEDKDGRQRMSVASRALSKDFSWQTIAQRIEGVYEKVGLSIL